MILVDEDYEWILRTYSCRILTTLDGNRYVEVREGRRGVGFLHQWIIGMPIDRKLMTDHINGDGLDNRKCNLRLVTNKQNQANSRKNKSGKSKYKGVSYRGDRKKWRAYICPDRRFIHLGYFNTEREAAEAYNRAAKESFGEFARGNEV